MRYKYSFLILLTLLVIYFASTLTAHPFWMSFILSVILQKNKKNSFMSNMYCLLTNDVETTSIWHNSLRDETGLRVFKEGMPLLLDIYKQYNIKSTFFYWIYCKTLS